MPVETETQFDDLRPHSASLEHELADMAEPTPSLRKRVAQLVQSNREWQQFGYVVSHDLEEPLRTIIGFAQLLDRQESLQGNPGCRELLGHIVEGTTRMRERMSALLDYARTGAAGEPQSVDLNEVIEDTCTALQALLQEAAVELNVAILPVVQGDRMRLLHVFQNLVANSVKYRCPERISRIAIHAVAEKGTWTIAVEDNGRGFPPEDADRIFGVFQRLHGADLPGTGVGLAIAKRIVKQHGGRIWAEGRPGQGAIFRFQLPAERACLVNAGAA